MYIYILYYLLYLNILYFISAFCVLKPPFFPLRCHLPSSCEIQVLGRIHVKLVLEISGRSLGDLWPLGNLWDGDISASKLRRIISKWGSHYITETYESQWEGFSHILWTIKHVPNMFQTTNQIIWVWVVGVCMGWYSPNLCSFWSGTW